MGELSIRQILERACSLSDDKLSRLLEDLPKNALIRLEYLALREEINRKNPELFRKISKAADRRVK